MTGMEVAALMTATAGLLSVLGNIVQWVVGKKWKTKAVTGEEVLAGTQEALAVVVGGLEVLDKGDSGKAKQTITAIRDGVEAAGRVGFAKAFDNMVQAVGGALRVFGLGQDEDESAFTERAVQAVRLAAAKRNLLELPK